MQNELVPLVLEWRELRVDRLDAVAALPHACLHRLTGRPTLARSVALRLQLLLLGPQLPAALVEIDDAIERCVEMTLGEHGADARRVVPDLLEDGHERVI